MNSSDKETDALLEVIGSSVVHTYFNTLLDKARYIKSKTKSSLTDCYKFAISEYIKDINTPEFYKNIIKDIRFYTVISTIYSDISSIQCINLYSALFVPKHYFQSMNQNQKNDILSMILRNSIQNFNNVLLSDYLSAIIDGCANQQSTVEELQNLFFQKIKFERDQMYNKFIKSEIEHKQNNTRIKPNSLLTNSSNLSNQDKSKIILNITEKYKNCIEGYNTIKEKNKALKSKYNNIITQCKEVQNICLGQLKIMKSYETEITKLKSMNTKLANELNQTQYKLKKIEANSTLELGNSLHMNNLSSSNNHTNDNDDFNISEFKQPEYLDSDDDV